jgi:hypothetical protein
MSIPTYGGAKSATGSFRLRLQAQRRPRTLILEISGSGSASHLFPQELEKEGGPLPVDGRTLSRMPGSFPSRWARARISSETAGRTGLIRDAPNSGPTERCRSGLRDWKQSGLAGGHLSGARRFARQAEMHDTSIGHIFET